MDEIEQQNPTVLSMHNSLQELVTRFLASLDLMPNSKASYKRSLKQYVKWTMKEKRFNPKRQDILEYKSYLESKGLSSYSWSAYLTALRRFYEFLESEKIYPNVAKGIRGGRRTKGFAKDPLSVDQTRELLRSIDRTTILGKRDFAIINLLLRTALRTIEIVRVSVGDIRQESGQPVLWVQGKGRDSKDEFVVLTDSTLKPIREYLSVCKDVSDNDPLFTSLSDRNQNKRLTTRSISRIVKERLKKIGVNNRRISAHSCRHSGITYALKNGASLQEVQNLARHASIETTMIYAHTISKIDNGVEKRIDDYIGDIE